VAPNDRINLPFRVVVPAQAFDSFTDCMNHAKTRGYGQH